MLIAEGLQDLAALTASGIIGAVSTDVWTTLKRQTVRLLGRDEPDREAVLEQRLDATRAALGAAPPEQWEQVRDRETTAWRTRLADLLQEWPDGEAAVRELAESLRRAGVTAPGAVFQDAVINHASHGGVAAAVINGPVSTAYPFPPGAATP